MRKRKFVPHQISLIAFETREDGSLVVNDAVETSYRHASFFARQWLRDPIVTHIAASSPYRDRFDFANPRKIAR